MIGVRSLPQHTVLLCSLSPGRSLTYRRAYVRMLRWPLILILLAVVADNIFCLSLCPPWKKLYRLKDWPGGFAG